VISGVDTVLVATSLACGVALLVLAWRGRGGPMEVLRRRTRPLGSLAEGAAEAEGTIRALEAPFTSTAGVRCVAQHLLAEELVGTGRGARWETREERRDCVPASLTDSSGSCAVDLNGAEILGEIYRETRGRHRVTVRVIPEGSHVLVLGEAAAGGAASGEGYRDLAVSYVLRAGRTHGLLVSTAGHAGTLWKVSWPAAVSLVCGATSVAIAYGLAAVSRWLASYVR
jgi:hypothetical protein